MATNPDPVRKIVDRDAERSAPMRCVAYAALSELVASPHEVDPRSELIEKADVVADLPYGAGLAATVRALAEKDLEALKKEYSGLFEVGSDGPPVPIREDLQMGQRAGTREDLVRFYNYFNYKLAERFAWAPDHLSVQLEFMHFLCFGEATAERDAESFQLAQFDFSERHLVRWLPNLQAGVDSVAPDAFYAGVVRTVGEFVSADHAWQRRTIVDGGESDG